MKIEHRNYLLNYINDNCIFRLPPGVAIKGSKSNSWYSWQFYLRRAIFDPYCSHIISEWIYENSDVTACQFAGMESAGPPLLSSLMSYSLLVKAQHIKGFAIRKERKKYGMLNWIEGFVDGTLPIILLDDIANSKTTISRASEICKNHGFEVSRAMTIVNKSNDSDAVDDIPVSSIFKISDFQLEWAEYYKNKPEPDHLEFVEKYKSILYLNLPNRGYVRAYEVC